MPQRDLFHQTVRTALEREGWLVTHDPLPLRFGARRLFVDLGAEAPIAAEKSGRKIAVASEVFGRLFDDADGRDLVATQRVRLLVFDVEKGVVTRWIE